MKKGRLCRRVLSFSMYCHSGNCPKNTAAERYPKIAHNGNIKLLRSILDVRIKNHESWCINPTFIGKPEVVLLSHAKRRNISKPAWTNAIAFTPFVICLEIKPRSCSTTNPCRKPHQENFELQEGNNEHCHCTSIAEWADGAGPSLFYHEVDNKPISKLNIAFHSENSILNSWDKLNISSFSLDFFASESEVLKSWQNNWRKET